VQNSFFVFFFLSSVITFNDQAVPVYTTVRSNSSSGVHCSCSTLHCTRNSRVARCLTVLDAGFSVQSLSFPQLHVHRRSTASAAILVVFNTCLITVHDTQHYCRCLGSIQRSSNPFSCYSTIFQVPGPMKLTSTTTTATPAAAVCAATTPK
jgi:hypothetical protein